MIKVFWLCCLVFIGSCGNRNEKQQVTDVQEEESKTKQKPEAFNKEKREKIDLFFRVLNKKKQFNGNVLFYKDGRIFKKAYGTADFRTGEPLTLDHKFQLASVSKPFTAAAVLMLSKRGLLRLSDSIQVYFPDFPYKNITIELLLTHRSGLGNYMYITDDLWKNKELPLCNDNALDSLIRHRPDPYYRPDQTFNYCNTNYFLLAAVMEKVTGMTYESLMQKYVFNPLGMENTFVYSNMDYLSIPGIAPGHNAFGNVKPDFYLNGVTGDKGIYSTVEDLFLFDRALTEGKILNENFKELMFLPHSPFDRNHKSYAYGWRIKRLEDIDVIYHKGWWRGYRSYFLRIPEKDLAIIILNNTTAGSFLSVKELVGLALGDEERSKAGA